jgi:hypothetical protein
MRMAVKQKWLKLAQQLDLRALAATAKLHTHLHYFIQESTPQ